MIHGFSDTSATFFMMSKGLFIAFSPLIIGLIYEFIVRWKFTKFHTARSYNKKDIEILKKKRKGELDTDKITNKLKELGLKDENQINRIVELCAEQETREDALYEIKYYNMDERVK